MIDFNLLTIILFYSVIAALIFWKRKKIERQYIFLLYRTKYGIKLLNKIASFKTFWKWWGYLGIPAGFIGMAIIFWFLIKGLIDIIKVPEAPPSLGLVLPGVNIPGSPIFVPFWYGIIALAVTILVHEGAHGIISRVHNIRINHTGVGLLIALPVAFVEPDEKQLNKAKLIKKLSIFAAGPFSNMCTAFIVLLVSTFILLPAAANVTEDNGIYVVGTSSGLPAASAGISEGDIIVGINKKPVVNLMDFVAEMENVKPGDNIKLIFDDGQELEVVAASNPADAEKALLGVQFRQNIMFKEEIVSKYGNKLPWSLYYLIQLFHWIFILNIGIGLINLLPLGPIDGGRIVKDSLEKYIRNKKLALKVFKYISVFSLAILILNFIGPYII